MYDIVAVTESIFELTQKNIFLQIESLQERILLVIVTSSCKRKQSPPQKLSARSANE
jgi:hypothetical protein